ncbi:MAG: NAD(P)/FAD-dependent oxidoreductase [Francisella endosymbiont of Hyalomma scupense]
MSAKNYDVIIIGAGAAGLMCTIQATKEVVKLYVRWWTL